MWIVSPKFKRGNFIVSNSLVAPLPSSAAAALTDGAQTEILRTNASHPNDKPSDYSSNPFQELNRSNCEGRDSGVVVLQAKFLSRLSPRHLSSLSLFSAMCWLTPRSVAPPAPAGRSVRPLSFRLSPCHFLSVSRLTFAGITLGRLSSMSSTLLLLFSFPPKTPLRFFCPNCVGDVRVLETSVCVSWVRDLTRRGVVSGSFPEWGGKKNNPVSVFTASRLCWTPNQTNSSSLGNRDNFSPLSTWSATFYVAAVFLGASKLQTFKGIHLIMCEMFNLAS